MEAIGCSAFLQSAPFQSSSSSFRHYSITGRTRVKVAVKTRASPVVSFSNGVRPFDERCAFRRRVVLLIGVSVLPFLWFREMVSEDLEVGSNIQDCRRTTLNEAHENGFEAQQPNKSMGEAQYIGGGSLFATFLNGVGVSGSGALGALFLAYQREEKARLTIDFEDEQFITKAMEDKKLLEPPLLKKADQASALKDKFSPLSSGMHEEVKSTESLVSTLAERDSECITLSPTIENLKGDIFKSIAESNLKSSVIDDLNEKIKSLTEEEKHYFDRKINHLLKDYNDLASLSERTAAEKDEQLRKLEDELNMAKSDVLNTIKLREIEKNSIYNLEKELQCAHELLDSSKAEFSRTSDELAEAKAAYQQVLEENSKLKEDAKSSSKILLEKIESANALLKSMEEELISASNELNALIDERQSLKMELNGERKVITDLNEKLEELLNQSQTDSETQKRLMVDLDEAKKSLEEMSKSALLLATELESTNSRNGSLEEEKEMHSISLIEHKNAAKIANENMEDAHNLITKLGGEREKLMKWSKKLEDELAVSKGEILRLRRKISVDEKANLAENHSTSINIPVSQALPSKRSSGRRRKRSPGSGDSCSKPII